MAIIELSADVHDLVMAHRHQEEDLKVSRSPAPPNDLYVQGRSRRRQKRIRRRTADSSSDEDSGDEQEAAERADRTLKADVSLADVSVKDRIGDLGTQLDQSVRTLIEGVEELSRSDGPGDEHAEGWAMLSFALQHW